MCVSTTSAHFFFYSVKYTLFFPTSNLMRRHLLKVSCVPSPLLLLSTASPGIKTSPFTKTSPNPCGELSGTASSEHAWITWIAFLWLNTVSYSAKKGCSARFSTRKENC